MPASVCRSGAPPSDLGATLPNSHPASGGCRQIVKQIDLWGIDMVRHTA